MEEPQIRINGFEGKWKRIYFKEITQRISTTKSNSTLPRIEYEDIISGEGRLNKDITKKKSNKNGLYFSPADLLYGKLRPYLKNIYLPSFEGVAVGDFWILRSLTNSPEFLYLLTNTKAFDKVANVSVGSKMPRADWNLVSNSDFYIPSDVKEQQAIANFFKSLDLMITLTSKKIEKLKQTLTGCMQTMFPQEGEFEPKVRFKGFDGEWKVYKIGDISKKIKRIVPNSKASIMMITAQNGFIDQSDRYSFNNAGESLKKYIELHKGELAYNHGASKLRPFGSCFALNVEKARVPFVYHCFSVNENNDPEFISFVLNNVCISNQLRKIITSGARMDGLLNISFEEYCSLILQLPSLEEQQRIVSYFYSLNRMIFLQTKRLDLLKHIKSACLDNMFV